MTLLGQSSGQLASHDLKDVRHSPKPKDSWLVQQAEALVEQSESVTIDSRKSRDSELIYECS